MNTKVCYTGGPFIETGYISVRREEFRIVVSGNFEQDYKSMKKFLYGELREEMLDVYPSLSSKRDKPALDDRV